MTTITALPDAPNPLTDSQSAYNSKALAFTQALPTLVSEINTVSGEVNANAGTATTQAGIATTKASEASGHANDAADQVTLAAEKVVLAAAQATAAAASAASAVNAPGTSATSTTSRSIATGSVSFTIQTGKAFAVGQFVAVASTASPGNYMAGQITAHDSGTGALTVNATNIAGSGTFAAWTISVIGAPGVGSASGANVQSISADLTLTASSEKVQSLSATAENLSFILPDATTLIEGGALYVVENTGSIPIGGRDSSGVLKTVVQPGQICVCYLKDNSTAAGVWAFGSERGGELGGVLSYTAVAAGTGSGDVDKMSVVPLTSTTALLFLGAASTSAYAFVLTISGTSVAVGTQNTLTVTSGYSASSTLERISDTQVLVTLGTAGANVTVNVLTVSGASVTLGTPVTSSVYGGGQESLARVSNTQAILAGADSGGTFRAQVISVSTTTCSAGTAYTWAVSASYTKTCVLTSTLFCVATETGAATNIRYLAISGTNINATSMPNELALEKYPDRPIGIARVSDTSALLVTIDTSTGAVSALVVSPRTGYASTNYLCITAALELSRRMWAGGYTKNQLTPIGDGKFMCVGSGGASTVTAHFILRATETAIHAGDARFISTSDNGLKPVAAVGSKCILLTSTGATAPFARVLEVA